MKENSIKEAIILLKDFTEGNFKRDKLENYKGSYKMGYFYYKDIQQAIEHLLSEVDIKEKDIEDWKKYCEEIEEEQTEMSNKNYELEFEVEKLQKENEELNLKYYMLYTGKIENLKAQEVKIKSQVIPVQTVKDKIEELNSRIEKYREYVKQGIETDVEWVDNAADRETVKVLQELLESEDSKDGENKKSTNTIRNSRT